MHDVESTFFYLYFYNVRIEKRILEYELTKSYFDGLV